MREWCGTTNGYAKAGSLQQLYVRQAQISEACVGELGIDRLKVLELTEVTNLTDDVLVRLATRLMDLRVLYVGTTAVSNGGISQLAEPRENNLVPLLEHLDLGRNTKVTIACSEHLRELSRRTCIKSFVLPKPFEESVEEFKKQLKEDTGRDITIEIE